MTNYTISMKLNKIDEDEGDFEREHMDFETYDEAKKFFDTIVADWNSTNIIHMRIWKEDIDFAGLPIVEDWRDDYGELCSALDGTDDNSLIAQLVREAEENETEG